MSSSLSIIIIGGAYGDTLDRAVKLDGFTAGSKTLSWKKKKRLAKHLKVTLNMIRIKKEPRVSSISQMH